MLLSNKEKLHMKKSNSKTIKMIVIIAFLMLFPSIITSVFCGQIVFVNNVLPFNKLLCSYPDKYLQCIYDLEQEAAYGSYSIKELLQDVKPQQFRMTTTGFYTIIPSTEGRSLILFFDWMLCNDGSLLVTNLPSYRENGPEPVPISNDCVFGDFAEHGSIEWSLPYYEHSTGRTVQTFYYCDATITYVYLLSDEHPDEEGHELEQAFLVPQAVFSSNSDIICFLHNLFSGGDPIQHFPILLKIDRMAMSERK